MVRTLGLGFWMVALTLCASCATDPESNTTSSGGALNDGGNGAAGASGGAGEEGGDGGIGGGSGQGGDGGGTASLCGNGLVDQGEDCDLAGANGGEECNANCAYPDSLCGNGKAEQNEQCDDGNTAPNDACDASCQLESGTYCGDSVDLNDAAVVTIDGATTTYDGTISSAALKNSNNYGAPGCGEGILEDSPTAMHRFTATVSGAYELRTASPIGASALDDPVMWLLTDCLAATQILACHDDMSAVVKHAKISIFLPAGFTIHVAVAGSANGTGVEGSYRLQVVQRATCGNGELELGELCDDGNNTSADGCSPICKLEPLEAELEPNDGSDQATPFAVPTLGAISAANDVDWYRVTVPTGHDSLTAIAVPALGNSCGVGDESPTEGPVDAKISVQAAGSSTVLGSYADQYCGTLTVEGLTPGDYDVSVAATNASSLFNYTFFAVTEDNE